ncbi:MAG: DUF1599 domain-containing protein [Clostridia bacterium]|nr:DUF1599 domain-containing protein [Clostridia bacterium]
MEMNKPGGPVNDKTINQATTMRLMADNAINQFVDKNVAYGDSFGKQFQKYGPISALVRVNDKFSRVEALTLGAQNNVSDESIEDTLIDMATYCLMWVYEHRRANKDGKE